VKGWALGAGTTVDECRILCRWHQDVSARRLYGEDLMNNYTRAKGPTCSESIAEYGAAAPHYAPASSPRFRSLSFSPRCDQS
jgi:hypothetical protein